MSGAFGSAGRAGQNATNRQLVSELEICGEQEAVP